MAKQEKKKSTPKGSAKKAMNKSVQESEDGPKRGRPRNAVARTATTVYFKEDLYEKFRARVFALKRPGYEILEQCMEAYLAISPRILEDLEDAALTDRRNPHAIVESALSDYLKKRRTR